MKQRNLTALAAIKFVVLTGILTALALLLLPLASAFAAPSDATADRVYGQANFTDGACDITVSSTTTMCAPWGAAVDSAGHLFVADQYNDRVLVYDNPLSTAAASRVIGLGSGDGPTGVAVDPAGHLFVSVALGRVLEFDTPLTSSVLTRTINLPPGTVPNGLGTDTAGRLYVADAYFSRVIVLDNPTTSNTVNHAITTGSGSFASNVAIDPAGHLFIADSGNSRILEYDNPLTSPIANRVIGQPDFGIGSCNRGGLSAISLCKPLGVAVDSTGHLLVSDTNNSRVLVYDNPLGACVTCDATADQVLGQSGSMTSNVGNNGGIMAQSMCGPIGIAADPAGNVFVGECNSRVLEFNSQAAVGGAVDLLTTPAGGPSSLVLALAAGTFVALLLSVSSWRLRRRISR